ncbi:TRC40/GET3/ArsA family transport-energizing ATPase [Roseofilum sp. BLCC_M154]|uniref:TRC40/GET3/ArsA family transport-energizing ATPase n=1 Tax=Roseofilum acuticapitatum BLCC-M154 TaxID=3022444 RepID=A0ABT7AWR4_9CYAN|nr:TRC40/GET3/ArsA family transport-energizing ATPase [Roseofilum acuticapitatum]MDJ1171361.1 TRC40/GET3/ArsA family transport-energizing ATPase [Roseofilum acuticapitatum BLCC-M154]
MNSYDRLQLLLLSGKGGVGKTTLSCGFARYWAQRFPEEKILLLSTDPAHSLGDVLQCLVTGDRLPLPDLPNLEVQALDAAALLQEFKQRYGEVLQLLVERGSFASAEDLTPVWDLSWPGLDELMGILEIQRLLREQEVDRVVVDMAPSGHALNLLGLMDFLDQFLEALDLFQEKHRAISQAFTGRYQGDRGDEFLQDMKADLQTGRALLQDQERTRCVVVGIAEAMSLEETRRFVASLQGLQIPLGGIWVNRLVDREAELSPAEQDRYAEQQQILPQFQELAGSLPLLGISQCASPPLGSAALDGVIAQMSPIAMQDREITSAQVTWPDRIPPGLPDFMAQERRLIIIGGKGGVGKTTVAAAIAWGMAQTYPQRQVRVISIDPAHSLGDALGQPLDHDPQAIDLPNLTAAEIDSQVLLNQFREAYLWELAEMISGDSPNQENLKLLYGPEAWRKLVSLSFPGIDEILALLAVMELLESQEQDLIILDTAPTGHLLRFLEMPTALADWLAWVFKLWIKYQDVLGRTEFMGELRTLRKRVVAAQKKLKDPQHTEFIGVVQNQPAILAEHNRLSVSLRELEVSQNYVVWNYGSEIQNLLGVDPEQTVIHLPPLPRSVQPLVRIQGAARLLFEPS